MAESQRQSEYQPLLRDEEIEATPVYPLIHMIRADVIHFIDTPLSYDALMAPDLTYTLVRPLQEKYNTIQRNGNRSVVFCFLLNRVHFVRDQHVMTASLSRSRAELCEILAIRTLRDYGTNMLDLTLVITTSWPVYSGADERIMDIAREERDDIEDRVGNAIEMAIVGRAKRFIKSSSCQKIINGIWSGKCVYQAESSHSILSDTYKRTPIHFYDPHKAPLLDHYRLKVPAIRSVLEYMNFLVLFILFVIAIELNEIDKINPYEAIFMFYALGFALEKVAAMQEHGIRVYFTGTWNGFDLAFVTTYLFYAILRLYGVYHYDDWAKTNGIDCLALIACLMFPRLAFVTLKDNLMVLSLRAMIVQFFALMLIAMFCFGGFLYALWTLSRNEAGYSISTIALWMADLWFGLDASGFEKATQFHQLFGPILMVTYACLSNTLLLTVLVSILSHTFSTINEDAAAEAMFRTAVSTIEGVKADSLFSYQPPVNLIALCVMLPASHVLSPRWFHKVNVFMIRATSFPILLVIAWYERQSKRTGAMTFYETITLAAEKVFDTLPRSFKRMTIFEGLSGADADIDAIFDIEDDGESALDLNDGGFLSHEGGERPRRFSQKSHKSRKSSRSRRSPPRPPIRPSLSVQSPQRPGLSPPQSPVSIPRNRLNSHLSREPMQTYTSPLAQIYQPLIVDDMDGIPENEEAGPSNQSGISYGPASRRRLTSMNVRGPLDPFAGQIAHTPLARFPTMRNDSRRRSSEERGRSRSRDARGTSEPETVEEVAEEEINSGGIPGWSRRLDKMEERQKRIEDLLMEVASKIQAR